MLVLASSHCSEPHQPYSYLQLQDSDGPQDELEPLIVRPVLAFQLLCNVHEQFVLVVVYIAIKLGHGGTEETQRCDRAGMDLLTGAASEVAHE